MNARRDSLLIRTYSRKMELGDQYVMFGLKRKF